MSEHELHAIEASLRRQLEPPSLDALADRIAAAAAAIGEDDADIGHEPALRAVDSADANATEATAARRRVVLGGLAALAAAAAIVLLLAQPRAPETGPEIATAITTQQVAGRQLEQFLRSAAYREGPSPDDVDCVEEPPITGCASDLGEPVLPPSPELRVVWECGGSTGIDCAAHDLPARRMMVVQWMPAGPDVIVCIEPPWADPEPELPADSGYNIFRRTLGDYVLYEITPLDTPHAVDSLTIQHHPTPSTRHRVDQ